MSLFALKNLPIARKLFLSLAIFIFPVFLLAYFLVTEKDDLISFTQQEIAGVTYLRAATAAVGAMAPDANAKQTIPAAIEALKKAEAADAGALSVTDKTGDLIKSMEAAVASGDTSDALAKASTLISALSDNSNITLDPDADAYFVGDIIVNQAMGVLQQSYALAAAAHDVDADHSEDHRIAFAEARDGLSSSAGNLATDLAKALKNNGTGSVKENMEEGGKVIAAAVDRVEAAAKGEDRAELAAALNALVTATRGYVVKTSDEMELLLNARIDGFHEVLFTRLGISLISVLLGGLVAFVVVRSITKPLTNIANLMGRITAGDLDVDVPHDERTDEIGKLGQALQAYHAAAVNNDKAQKDERRRAEQDRMRSLRMKELNETFQGSVSQALAALRSAVTELRTSSNTMDSNAETSTQQVAAVAAAAEQASANVQTVAAAAEELSSSIQEISRNLTESKDVTAKASDEARQTRQKVSELSEATAKIGDVVSLINQIAGQTNLLALNATIEAARAGEAGKGFAVVASEVKALANQTARATEDITGHIAAIQDSVRKVEQAMGLIDGTITKVNDIAIRTAAAVEQQGVATTEISRNVQEAAVGTSEVTTNITRISEMVSNTGVLAKNVLSSSKMLDQQTGQLDEDVSSYLGDIQKI